MGHRRVQPKRLGRLPLPYQAALDELGVTVREAQALAKLLDCFAAVLPLGYECRPRP
jgi:hypothetical protein